MTDHEMLPLAAKAAGYTCYRFNDQGAFEVKADPLHPWCAWAPHTDDGESLRLAARLGGDLRVDSELGRAWFGARGGHAHAYAMDHGGDLNAAVRHATLSAAAVIGKDLP